MILDALRTIPNRLFPRPRGGGTGADEIDRRQAPVEIVTTRGIKIPMSDFMSPTVKNYIRGQGYEIDELDLVECALKPEDLVMELGTGIGLVSSYCAKKVGSPRVFTYEANPELEPHIRAVYELNQVSPTLSMCMLGRKSGQHKFYLSEHFYSSSTIKRAPTSREIMVPVKPVTDQIRKIDPSVLIIDIEGGEHDLLMDAEFGNVRLLTFEMHTDLIGQENDAAIRARLQTCGFRFNEKLSVVRSASRSNQVWDRL